jgi:hypothetical protein
MMTQEQLDIARMQHRLDVAERILKPVSILQLCGIRTMDYCDIKKLVDEFWASGVKQGE